MPGASTSDDRPAGRLADLRPLGGKTPQPAVLARCGGLPALSLDPAAAGIRPPVSRREDVTRARLGDYEPERVEGASRRALFELRGGQGDVRARRTFHGLGVQPAAWGRDRRAEGYRR